MKGQTGIKRSKGHIYVLQLLIMTLLSAGWWGILYPNLGLTGETYQVVFETREGYEEYLKKKDRAEWEFFGLLQAKPGEVEIKSRLWERLKERERKDEGKREDE